MSHALTKMVRIAKKDDAKRIVYGLVYAPYVMDTEGEFMLPEDIEKMAHSFMTLDLKSVIDTNHDRQPNGCFPVESYIAKAGDPDFVEGSWVLGVKCTDDMWDRVLKGEINSYSFEAMVYPQEVEIEVSTYRDAFGQTEVAKSDDGEDHDHVYFAYVNEMGKVTKGYTDVVNGHSHVIRGGSRTLKADGHSHRYFL